MNPFRVLAYICQAVKRLIYFEIVADATVHVDESVDIRLTTMCKLQARQAAPPPRRDGGWRVADANRWEKTCEN